MLIDTLVGDWVLVARALAHGEADVMDGQADPASATRWLGGSGVALIQTADAASGLRLGVQADGRFCERMTGDASGLWFDAHGVQTAAADPFDGVLMLTQDCAYLLPHTLPAWATPAPGAHAPAILRFDDGDTCISDRLDVSADTLVRTMNCVTDGICLERVVLVYRRA